MKNAKKWRRNLQTIEFPNYEKYSDNEIMQLIYEDVPERQAVLKWIAFKISDENPVLFNMSPEDIAFFFCDRGLLSSHQAKDFVQAQCSEKLNDDSWKVLFSFTRMHKFLRPSVEDRAGIRSKFGELIKGNSESRFSERGPSVTIEEIDSDNDMDPQVEEEIHNIRTELDKTSRQFDSQAAEEKLIKYSHTSSSTTVSPFTLPRYRSISPGTSAEENNVFIKKKEITPLFQIGRTVDEIKILNEKYEDLSEKNLSDNELVKYRKEKEPKKEWFKENDVVPRIYIMPGSPPLGQLDSSQLKIKIEDSAPPISIDGTPCSNHWQWQNRIFNVEKHVYKND